MKGETLLQHITAPESEGLFSQLYGALAVAAARERYLRLYKGTIQDFPELSGDLRIFTAPGRTELGGNHTDHNHGKVLAASIQLDSVAFVAPRRDNIVFFRSTGYPDVEVDLSDLSPRNEEIGTTEALIRGIAAEFFGRGVKINGFTANADSTVLRGSGLSSSAAVEVLIGTIFDCVYSEGKRGAVELAQIGQKAENVYFGKPCGLMDQVACANGGVVAIDFADPSMPLLKRVDFDPSAAGFTLCVVDTGGNHANLTADYAAVPEEMKKVAAFFGQDVLRGLNGTSLLTKAPEIRKTLGDRALLRALHFLGENERVDGMLQILENKSIPIQGYMEKFLSLVEASGHSSWELLQNVFSPTVPREQGIALALALTKDFLNTHPASSKGQGHSGCCRVHGGGFAGTIQAYIPMETFPAYAEAMRSIFGPGCITPLHIRPFGAGELHF